jgi:hypothetical protein
MTQEVAAAAMGDSCGSSVNMVQGQAKSGGGWIWGRKRTNLRLPIYANSSKSVEKDSGEALMSKHAVSDEQLVANVESGKIF